MIGKSFLLKESIIIFDENNNAMNAEHAEYNKKDEILKLWKNTGHYN